MADLRIDSAKLRGVASTLKSAAGAYGNDVREVYATAGKLGAAWQGSTSEAFSSKINGYKADLEQLEKDLNGWSAFLEKAAEEYETMLASIESALNG